MAKPIHIVKFEQQNRKVREGLLKYIDNKGRVGLTELIENVLPRVQLSHNDLIHLLEEMCNDKDIMIACVDSNGPRYQIFTWAFQGTDIDHSRYLENK